MSNPLNADSPASATSAPTPAMPAAQASVNSSPELRRDAPGDAPTTAGMASVVSVPGELSTTTLVTGLKATTSPPTFANRSASPPRLSASDSGHFPENMHHSAPAAAASLPQHLPTSSVTSPAPAAAEPPEEYLDRIGMPRLLEALVTHAIAERPADITAYAAAFFARQVEGHQHHHQQSLGPPVPGQRRTSVTIFQPTGMELHGHRRASLGVDDSSAGGSEPPSNKAASASPSIASSVNLPPGAATVPHYTPTASGATKRRLSAPFATTTTSSSRSESPADRRGSESSTSSGKAAGHHHHHVTLIGPTTAGSGRRGSGTDGSGSPDAPPPPAMATVPSVHEAHNVDVAAGRPRKRQLRRMFPPPPVNEFEFDGGVPPREGHYGIVRRARWGDRGLVAVKMVSIEASWTLDELGHLGACAVKRQPSSTMDGSSSPTVLSPQTSMSSSQSPRNADRVRAEPQHWDVVQCHAAFYDPKDDKLWYVFDWIDHTLEDLVAARHAAAGLTSLDAHVALAPSARATLERDVAFVIKQLLSALQHVHNVGNRVHLDVKPANILVRRRKPSRSPPRGGTSNRSSATLSPPPAPTLEPAPIARRAKGGAAKDNQSGSDKAPTSGGVDASDHSKPVGAKDGDHQQPTALPKPPDGSPAASRVRRVVDEVAEMRSGGKHQLASYTAGSFDVVLADFGTAQEMHAPLEQLGDFKYMAPEVYTAHDVPQDEGGVSLPASPHAKITGVTSGSFGRVGGVDIFREANDVWSVGVVAIYSLEGYAPFDGSQAEYSRVLRSCWMQPALQHPMLWSQPLQHFLSLCFERDARLRPSIESLLVHDWLTGGAPTPAAATTSGTAAGAAPPMMADSGSMPPSPLVTVRPAE